MKNILKFGIYKYDIINFLRNPIITIFHGLKNLLTVLIIKN